MRPPVTAKTLVIITGILFLLFSLFAWIEFFQSKTDMMRMIRNQGVTLLDALMTSSRNSILAALELEASAQDRLFQTLSFLESLDRQKQLDRHLLQEIAEKASLEQIVFFSPKGWLHTIYRASDGDTLFWYTEPSVRTAIDGLRRSEEDSLWLGVVHDSMYGAALRQPDGGVIAALTGRHPLDALRKQIGPGRLIQDIGAQPGIAYVVLQDTTGILMASSGVEMISRIESDPFLHKMTFAGSQSSRITEYRNEEILEIAGSFVVNNIHYGIFRIGLALDNYRQMMRNARYRLFFIPLLLILAGAISIGLLLAQQNMRLLSESYTREKVQSDRILENLENAVVAIDAKGMIAVYNRAAESLFEIRNHAVIGKDIQESSLPVADDLLHSLQTHKAVTRENREIPCGEKRKIIFSRTSVIIGREKRIMAVILIATDMTQQRRLENELRRKEKLIAMGKLASGVAHEIRNPLNAIGMIAQRLVKEFRPSADAQEYDALVHAMREEITRTGEIITRFLQFSKPQPLRLEALTIQNFLQETGRLFESSARNRDIRLSIRVHRDGSVLLDRIQMKQALLNILQNALEATSSGGFIEIKGNSLGEYAVISVRDNGRGIDPQDMHQIFDLYFTRKENGTGMGLPIAQQIVQAHGGEIQVESVPGTGTVFILRIPIKEPS